MWVSKAFKAIDKNNILVKEQVGLSKLYCSINNNNNTPLENVDLKHTHFYFKSLNIIHLSNMMTCLSPARSKLWERRRARYQRWCHLGLLVSSGNLLQNEGYSEKTWASCAEVCKGNFSIYWSISSKSGDIEQANTWIGFNMWPIQLADE